MAPLSIIVIALAAVAGAGLARGLTTALPAIVSVLGSSLVAWAVYRAGRTQDRIKTTLELHKEYYSPSFGTARTQAEHFYQLHHDRDWGAINPYDLDDPEDKLKGYSEVLRFFHRLSILWQRARLDEDLLASLFSREMGYWMGFVFEPMDARTDWWTKPDIKRLAEHLKSSGGDLYVHGREEGTARRISGPIRVLLADGSVMKRHREAPLAAAAKCDPAEAVTGETRLPEQQSSERRIKPRRGRKIAP